MRPRGAGVWWKRRGELGVVLCGDVRHHSTYLWMQAPLLLEPTTEQKHHGIVKHSRGVRQAVVFLGDARWSNTAWAAQEKNIV